MLKLLSTTITHKSGCRRRAPEPERGSCRAGAYRKIESAVLEKAGPGHFQGVTVQPMIRVDGYEAHCRHHARSSLRAGAAVRLGRTTGGSVQRPRAGPAAAQHHAGAAHDGADPALSGAPRRSRAQAGDLAALEQLLVRFSQLVVAERAVKEIDINPLLVSGEDWWRSMPASCCTGESQRRPAAAPCDSAVPESIRGFWTSRDGIAAHHPPDPPGRRAIDGEVPSDAFRRQRLPALFSHGEPRPACRSRAPDPHLLHRLRPRDGARCRTPGSADRRR